MIKFLKDISCDCLKWEHFSCGCCYDKVWVSDCSFDAGDTVDKDTVDVDHLTKGVDYIVID